MKGKLFFAGMDSNVDSLVCWLELLQEQKEAILRLLATTSAIRDSLEAGEDVSELLERRDVECRILKRALEKGTIAPYELTNQTDNESSKQITERIYSLQDEITRLGEELLLAQSECETIMRNRLQILAGALRESAQRRLVEYAYGPACNGTDSPVFIDRQQ